MCAGGLIEAAPLSGIKAIGPTGDYNSISSALVDVQTQSLSGALVLELQSSYSSTVESFPLKFTNLTTTAANTLTIRPALNATALTITSANTTAATVDLDGAQFVTIDGRAGGAGTTKQLTIANTSTSGVAVRFINESSSNTLQYITLKGANSTSTSGVVVFSTTTGANGNDSNTIDTCDIRDGAARPVNAIYALGTTTTTAQSNSGNTISNCNIFNFYSASAAASAGVLIAGGNTGWTLSGNSFYQTGSRVAVAGAVYVININSGGVFNVTGNYIGGTLPNAGGTPWTTTGTTAAYFFLGIRISASGSQPSSVQGNTIQNMVWTTSSNASSTPGIWCGILVDSGTVNVGTTTSNTVGSATGTGSISVTTSGTGGTVIGISSATNGTASISNNIIGSITANGSTTSVSCSIIGLQAANGTNVISNNTIGSTISASSLNAATSSSSTTGQQVTGISCYFTAAGNATITGNTVANLNNNYVGTAATGQVCGIAAVNAVRTITGNTVRALSTTSHNSFSAANTAVIGILETSTSAPTQTISQNIVHSLAATAGGSVTGIYFAGPTTGSNLIARNWVHSLAGSVLTGMELSSGSFTAQNNMVRVGLDANGLAAGTSFVNGINDNGTDAGRNYHHNSVYVGGAPTSGSASTCAFGSSGYGNALDIRNNVFFNARSNNGGTGSHYAAIYGGKYIIPNKLTANSNILLANGNGGVLGVYDSVTITTLAAWQSATGQDVSSAAINPLFVNPTGTAAQVDLHLQTNTPAAGAGLPINAVPDDFDGETRSSGIPADIGADTGSFTSSSGDIYAPFIDCPVLSNGSTSNRTLSGWATITDNSGTISSGVNAPRLYYKKSTDADVFGGNTAADNGWKYVTATGGSPFSFLIDYSLLNGGGVNVGDTIQYFVVAQDTANNLSSSPAAATASANSPVQNINGKPGAGVNSYDIMASLGGSPVTVGPGGTYTSLSGAGGLFAALNSLPLINNLSVTLTGNTVENGSTTLKAAVSNNYPPSANTFAVNIQPDSATMRTMSGSSASGLICLNGAQRVTIDGRFGGSGRYLTFRNTSTTAATILFTNDASNNTMRNCIIEGAVNTGSVGVVRFATGVTTGNDNNTVTGNQIRDRSDASGVPYVLVYSFSSSTLANSNNIISNNELFNFSGYGVQVFSGGDSWSITGNTIYQTAPRTTTLYGIYFTGLGTNTISGNSIHDLTTNSGPVYGIELFYSKGGTTVAGNRIWNLFNTSVFSTSVYGIDCFNPDPGQSVTMVNNMVTLSPSGTTAQLLYGICDRGGSGNVSLIAFNTVLITGTGGAGRDTWALNRIGTSTATVKNNIFLNLRTGGGNHFAANQLPGSTGPLTMDGNVYSGTGLTAAANFFDASDGYNSTGTPVSYAQWQANLSGDTHSSAGSPGGNYTSAMFVDPANGDLHLIPGGNPLVNHTGKPVAGVTSDFDNDARSATNPNVGADEAFTPEIAVEQPALTDLANGTATVDFGGMPVGSGTAAKTFLIRNTGTASLTVGSITSSSAKFTVNAADTAASVAADSSTTFSVTFSAATMGLNSASLQIVNNDGNEAPFVITLTGTGLTAVEYWRQQNFGTMANTGITADTADYDNDGLSNLLEWAMHSNPAKPGTLPAALTVNGAVVEFNYTRSVSAVNASAVFSVEWSDSLASNDWQTTGVTSAILSDDGTVQQVKATVPAGSSGRRFLRLKVTTAP